MAAIHNARRTRRDNIQTCLFRSANNRVAQAFLLPLGRASAPTRPSIILYFLCYKEDFKSSEEITFWSVGFPPPTLNVISTKKWHNIRVIPHFTIKELSMKEIHLPEKVNRGEGRPSLRTKMHKLRVDMACKVDPLCGGAGLPS